MQTTSGFLACCFDTCGWLGESLPILAISFQRCTVLKYLSKLWKIDEEFTVHQEKPYLISFWKSIGTKLWVKYLKCFSILRMIENAPCYPGYQLLATLGSATSARFGLAFIFTYFLKGSSYPTSVFSSQLGNHLRLKSTAALKNPI